MNVQDYISSGILEAYVMGDLSPLERAEVEQNLKKHPELRQELEVIEKTLQAFSFKAAVQPSAQVKEKLFATLDATAPEVSLATNSISMWRWAMAASVAFALVASYLAYDYRDRWIKTTVALNELIDRNQQVAQDYNQINLQLEKLQNDFSIIENASFTKVLLKGTANSPESLASVYWNGATKEAYLSIQNLKDLTQEQQFQLWAIVDGKPVDAGVFDGNFNGLLKMKSVVNPSAFAITIEPRGGRPTPTLETMQVLGSLSKS